jgi:Uma2 family endonuclease
MYRFHVEEYERLAGLGVLNDPRVELLDGLLMRKMTKRPEHSTKAERLRRLLERLIPMGWHLRKEEPVRLPDFNEPEPDIAAVRGDLDVYESRHPGAADVILIAEVSGSSLGVDRGIKLRAYAQAGIPIYWIVNLIDGQIEVYTHPAGDGYGRSETFKIGEAVPLIVEGREIGRIAVSELLT